MNGGLVKADRCDNGIPPEPGFGPCTREKGHSGPCSHPALPKATVITEHEGKKYLKTIKAAAGSYAEMTEGIRVDVYAVIEAFGVTCPARQHAIKKILCAGTRGKGDTIADLTGAIAALNRAIQLEEVREA